MKPEDFGKRIININLQRKYKASKDVYNMKVINDLIYNETANIVSVFKDYLIYDDLSEFLKRFYTEEESAVRLPKICDYYEKYSHVFPNYFILPENRFLFKNIKRKHKVIG